VLNYATTVWSMQSPAGTALDLNSRKVLKDVQNLQSAKPDPVTCSSKKDNAVCLSGKRLL